jgi:hypothetical protein
MTYTPQQVAEELGVSLATVHAFIRTRELTAACVSRNPASKKPRFRITQAALDSFLDARSPTTQQRKPRKRAISIPRKIFVPES